MSALLLTSGPHCVPAAIVISLWSRHLFHSVSIRRDNELFVFGYYYYRPWQARHPPSQRFWANELIRSDLPTERPMKEILGRCVVMDTASYAKGAL
jgi:hypothetical protein